MLFPEGRLSSCPEQNGGHVWMGQQHTVSPSPASAFQSNVSERQRGLNERLAVKIGDRR